MKQVTIGGDRLGSGRKQKVTLHGFERSTHDLGYVWRNTQAPGTLVPFMNLLALPGDDFQIDLGADVKTHPTIGPLFASFKLQLDVFQCPIRLYHAWLHNNKLRVGNDMSRVKLPQLFLDANPLRWQYLDDPIEERLEWQQINQSSLLSYLGIRGVGNGGLQTTNCHKNALSYLSYWDIYKNYYANKSEEVGMMIHTEDVNRLNSTCEISIDDFVTKIYEGDGTNIFLDVSIANTYKIRVYVPDTYTTLQLNSNYILDADITAETYDINTYSQTSNTPVVFGGGKVYFQFTIAFPANCVMIGYNLDTNPSLMDIKNMIAITTFDLENIDLMRERILNNALSNSAYVISKDTTIAPYNLPLKQMTAGASMGQMNSYCSQEGLALKTYQSDIFNNWLNTEWIDGDGGINEITSVSTAGGSFSMDTLNLAQKVYTMLNRIAISGGSYEDWQEAVYDHNGFRKAETPMYMGGLSKEIIFQEVISTAAATTIDNVSQDLGTLGGKGTMSKKHKGGSVHIRVDEPSIIMGIVSITPRIDYYQGNDWTTLLKTMDDLHKPSLDEIGFQELVTDKMAFWDTQVNNDVLTFKSAGKQPAWLDYMTNFNKLYGNFASESNEMFMTLARRYQPDATTKSIKDLTTYIDPTQYNYAFAQTDLTAQNFWVQIGCDITARRKMSAKLMPNL